MYRLFKKLGEDFNGDLFSDDLDAEAELMLDQHIKTLNDFFQGTTVRTGQASFWPYDFGFIPIETISAIYERFLKASDEQAGAFYTPRFLAEVVLDTALEGLLYADRKAVLRPRLRVRDLSRRSLQPDRRGMEAGQPNRPQRQESKGVDAPPPREPLRRGYQQDGLPHYCLQPVPGIP